MGFHTSSFSAVFPLPLLTCGTLIFASRAAVGASQKHFGFHFPLGAEPPAHPAVPRDTGQAHTLGFASGFYVPDFARWLLHTRFYAPDFVCQVLHAEFCRLGFARWDLHTGILRAGFCTPDFACWVLHARFYHRITRVGSGLRFPPGFTSYFAMCREQSCSSPVCFFTIVKVL